MLHEELCVLAGYDRSQANYPALAPWPKVYHLLTGPTTFSSVQPRRLYWVLFSFFDHYIKRVEVIDFRLFRATEYIQS